MFLELHFLFFVSIICLVDIALLRIHRSTLTVALFTLTPVLPWSSIFIVTVFYQILSRTRVPSPLGVGKGDFLLAPLAIGYVSSGHSFSVFAFLLLMILFVVSLIASNVVLGVERRYAGAPPIFLLTLLISEMH